MSVAALFEIVAGDRSVLSIEARALQAALPFVFGEFLMWAHGVRIGDPDDSAALNNCRDWLSELPAVDRSLSESAGLSALQIFRGLNDLVFKDLPELGEIDVSIETKEPYDFFINHIGMSSFERYRIVVVSDKKGSERLIWRSLDNDILHEVYYPAGFIYSVARDFVNKFDAAVAAFSAKNRGDA